MTTIQTLSITDDVSVNKQILRLQRLQQFTSRLLSVAVKMESVEKWTFDDLRLNNAGDPIGVNDERGTGEERMRVLRKLENTVNSRYWSQYLSTGQYTDDVDGPLIEVLSKMKTRRFLVTCYHIDRQSREYMLHLLQRMLEKSQTSGEAHVLRARLEQLNKLNIIQSIFSDESVKQVQRTLAAMKAASK